MRMWFRGLVAAVLLALFPSFVLAAPIVPLPDSGPFIVSYTVYQNTYTANDTLLLLEYNIPYATLPSDSATVNFLVRYLASDNTVLQTKTPFAYQSLGYGYGVAGFYWGVGLGPTWGESGQVQLIGNPSVSWAAGTPPFVSEPMMPANWSASTTVVQGRNQVCNAIVNSIAISLQSRWGVALTAQAATGTVLNVSYGQSYFSNIIPYFFTVCSQILTITGAQPVNPPSAASYSPTYGNSLLQIWLHSIIGPDITASAASIGVGTDLWLFGLFVVIATFTLAFLAFRLESPQFVPLIFIPIFVGGIKIGVVPMNIGVGICAVLFILSMYLLIHRRAAI